MSYLSPTQGTAGWFDDPTTPGVTRYWDGTGWTQRSFGEPLAAAPTGPPAHGPAPYAPGPARRGPLPRPTFTDGYAITSLVCGLLGIFCFIVSIAAISTGITARKRIRMSGGARTGDGMAIAGILLGVFWLLITVIYVALVVSAGLEQQPVPPPR